MEVASSESALCSESDNSTGLSEEPLAGAEVAAAPVLLAAVRPVLRGGCGVDPEKSPLPLVNGFGRR